ncbi:hypothetical protein PLICRDRAFT_181109 [Plicaturopsis crispa FD-325 SS-3]|uniref:Unplaced genomic scaffold PLICRscaffold_164, whole genome shotgun sequence n=1 Tax=Plicaturopsis crispa FD-325 SS-3 TaxID=944288 RepID=A0A0C9SJX2_PLICR|nr:hypothetical protein PLICRDRAFT_181109 [Plicaturopsis crispa FD-325 SS-3]
MDYPKPEIELYGKPLEYLPLAAGHRDFVELAIDVRTMLEKEGKTSPYLERKALADLLRYFQQEAKSVLEKRARRGGFWWMKGYGWRYTRYIQRIDTGIKHLVVMQELMDTQWHLASSG